MIQRMSHATILIRGAGGKLTPALEFRLVLFARAAALLLAAACVQLRIARIECKGLVGKLPGNPASCPEEPCNSDPQHVLYALKWMSLVFGLILLLPLLMYYISKLISKVRSLCYGNSEAGGECSSGKCSPSSEESTLERNETSRKKKKKSTSGGGGGARSSKSSTQCSDSNKQQQQHHQIAPAVVGSPNGGSTVFGAINSMHVVHKPSLTTSQGSGGGGSGCDLAPKQLESTSSSMLAVAANGLASPIPPGTVFSAHRRDSRPANPMDEPFQHQQHQQYNHNHHHQQQQQQSREMGSPRLTEGGAGGSQPLQCMIEGAKSETLNGARFGQQANEREHVHSRREEAEHRERHRNYGPFKESGEPLGQLQLGRGSLKHRYHQAAASLGSKVHPAAGAPDDHQLQCRHIQTQQTQQQHRRQQQQLESRQLFNQARFNNEHRMSEGSAVVEPLLASYSSKARRKQPGGATEWRRRQHATWLRQQQNRLLTQRQQNSPPSPSPPPPPADTGGQQQQQHMNSHQQQQQQERGQVSLISKLYWEQQQQREQELQRGQWLPNDLLTLPLGLAQHRHSIAGSLVHLDSDSISGELVHGGQPPPSRSTGAQLGRRQSRPRSGSRFEGSQRAAADDVC